MALYLGNQKVSLRSGQDLTFDYGFDSNGRLVFANKNAKEINNFLNYDSSYSEILDLSNLSKMEKVTVNGTADRKMEGLKGLLVSPNAPFTGSSPQINASYTGLSKSALVSLFESVPYNVGYTKVGNPTIVDGVVSGFSNSNYIKTSVTNSVLQENYTSSLEFCVKAKMPDTFSVTQGPLLYCKYNNSYNGIYINLNGRVIYNVGDSSYTIKAPVGTVSAGETVWIKGVNQNNTAELFISRNGENFTSLGSISLQGIGAYTNAEPIRFGVNASGSNNWIFTGSIDLNNTYIKVNGVPWFTGKAAMTKTCSIVGATGTADLTQEDKNIILNKGWAITIS